MISNWHTQSLSSVFVIRPRKEESRELLTPESLVSFLPMEDLGIFEENVIPNKERSLKEVTGSYTYFADNDVLLAKITPCFENGKLGIVRNLKNGIGFGSSEYIVFRSTGKIIPEYLYYFLSQDNFRKQGERLMTGASGHKRVSKDFIENYSISYPDSTNDQRRIVSILDKAFADIDKAKANVEKNIKNCKELFQSYLDILINSNSTNLERSRLKEVTTKIGSGATPSGGKNSYQDTGISLIRSLNVYDNQFNLANLAHINNAQADKLSNVIVHSGDVLLNITGASIARSIIAPENILPARVNQHVSIIRPKQEKLFPQFLHYLLISKTNKDRLQYNGEKAGATRQALTKQQLEEFTIKYPKSLHDQKKIVSKLDELSSQTKRLESIYTQKLADLEELRKSILAKAFRGEL